MKLRIAINGFGRIGRNAFKIAFDRSDIEIVAVNDLTDAKTLAHLLKHDTNYGVYEHAVTFDESHIIVNDTPVTLLSQKDPAQLPWRDLNIDVVIESTGFFVEPEKAKAHVTAGAKHVVISAPAKGEGASTLVLGVNEEQITQAMPVVSNGSCTTNCMSLVAAIIEEHFGIEKAMMTTAHSYTSDQRLQDAPHKDLRRARAAAENIIPTTTGAAIAAALVVPALKDRFGGIALRVPTPVVSLSDFVIVTKRDVTAEEVNDLFRSLATQDKYRGLLAVTDEQLVSSDFIGNSHSAIVDLPLTTVVAGNLLKVCAWYDNEWGYCNRLVEMTAAVGAATPTST